MQRYRNIPLLLWIAVVVQAAGQMRDDIQDHIQIWKIGAHLVLMVSMLVCLVEIIHGLAVVKAEKEASEKE